MSKDSYSEEKGWVPPTNTPFAQVIDDESSNRNSHSHSNADSTNNTSTKTPTMGDFIDDSDNDNDMSNIDLEELMNSNEGMEEGEFDLDDLSMEDLEQLLEDSGELGHAKELLEELNKDIGMSQDELKDLFTTEGQDEQDFEKLMKAMGKDAEEWNSLVDDENGSGGDDKDNSRNSMDGIDGMDVDDFDMAELEKQLQNLKEGEFFDPQMSMKKPPRPNIEIVNLDDDKKEETYSMTYDSDNETLDPSNEDEDTNDIWLSARRAKLGQNEVTSIMTPDQSKQVHEKDSSIPIIPKTLLSSAEIATCLETLGAANVQTIIPDEKTLPHLGWDGLILATGMSYSHIRVLADAIVSNLRKRDLGDMGVIGARYGAEGGRDTTTSPHGRKKMKQIQQGKRQDDGWLAIDCRNYIVHIQDEVTRRTVDLEGLWSPGERGKAGRDIRNLDGNDEDAVEDFVAANPVPDEYIAKTMEFSQDFWSDHGSRGGLGGGSERKNARWTPISNQKKKKKNSRKRRRF